LLGDEYNPDLICLYNACIRFLVSFSQLDLGYIYPVFNNSNFSSVILLQFLLISEESRKQHGERIIPQLVMAHDAKTRLNLCFKASLCCSYFTRAIFNTEGLSSYLIKCTPLMDRIFEWLEYGSLLNSIRTTETSSIYQGFLQSGVKEMLNNIAVLLDVLIE
jgi:hypothetical protein